jgi:hypothetical protein
MVLKLSATPFAIYRHQAKNFVDTLVINKSLAIVFAAMYHKEEMVLKNPSTATGFRSKRCLFQHHRSFVKHRSRSKTPSVKPGICVRGWRERS